MTPVSPLRAMLDGDRFRAYVYSYPHKTAYRRLDPPVPLAGIWREARRDALHLYLHIPFCEMRCGFCNLFTQVGAQGERIDRYLAALARQAAVVDASLRDRTFARMAIGGGTPTLLAPRQLERVLELARSLGADPRRIPCSVEVSPATADDERLAVLHEHGVDRISIGVQSFVTAETAGVSRHQDPTALALALARIRDRRFGVFNIDLMYGLPGQTVESWISTLRRALEFSPQELYCYPLYVRPLTTLGRRGVAADAGRLRLYREACAFLGARGWKQVSMRMFRAPDAPRESGPAYRCQDDAMVGLGCGARSYSESLHWSDPYAVSQSGVRDIITAYCDTSDADFRLARHGYRLDAEDRRRRYCLLSLLENGLDREAYGQRFGTRLEDDLPQLDETVGLGLAAWHGRCLVLTPAGIECADVIGEWLFSERVRGLMAGYEAA